MHNTNQLSPLSPLELDELATVTGGCKNKTARGGQAQPCTCDGGSVDVSVATGVQSQAPQLF